MIILINDRLMETKHLTCGLFQIVMIIHPNLIVYQYNAGKLFLLSCPSGIASCLSLLFINYRKSDIFQDV